MINGGIKRPPLDDSVLREWFERNRVKYDEPARLDFQEAVLDGDASEAATTVFATSLNAGTPGDVKAGLRVFQARPEPSIVLSFGAEFTAALQALPTGQWRALRHGDGWRVVRLNSVTASRAAAFESLRGVVLQDWIDAVMAEQRTAAVRTLAKKYIVKVESTQP